MNPPPPPTTTTTVRQTHRERERETGCQVDWSLSSCLSLPVSVSLSLAAGVGGSLRVRRQRAQWGRGGRTFTSSGSCSFSLPGSSLVWALMHKSWSLARSVSFSPLLPLNILRPSVCVSELRPTRDEERQTINNRQKLYCPSLYISSQFNFKYFIGMIGFT